MTRCVWAPYAALAAACLAAGLAAWWLAGGASPGRAADGEAPAAEGADDGGASGAQADAGAGASADGPDGDAAAGGGDLAPGGAAAAPASAAELLATLAAGFGAGQEETCAAWEADAGLEGAASELIGAYREDPGTCLLAYGYLDLSGNAWGAVVARAGLWVDVAVARADESDARTVVTVTRMAAGAGEGSEGEAL